VHQQGAPVEGSVGPADAEITEGHRFAAFEHFSGQMQEVRDTDRIALTLGAYGVKLYIFVPIRQGFAPIGLVSKYIAPKAVLRCARTARGARVVLREGGEFAAWIASKPTAVRVNGAPLRVKNWSYQGRTFRAHIPDRRSSTQPVSVEIILKR